MYEDGIDEERVTMIGEERREVEKETFGGEFGEI